MAQHHSQTQQRPAFAPQAPSFPQGFQQPNGRQPFSAQSPTAMPYSSPSPQPPSQSHPQFSPSYNGQAPPAKRPRLSPDAPSPFSPSIGAPHGGNAVAPQLNGTPALNSSRPGLMPPPQQPFIKREDKEIEANIFEDTGSLRFDLDSGALPHASLSPHPPATSTSTSPLAIQTSFSVPDPANTSTIGNIQALADIGAPQSVMSDEERTDRTQQRLDWNEARHAQHELWDPFLYGGTLNDRIKSISHRCNLVEPQSGVLVNTQKNQPPPVVRVNGLEGATRVIKDGQSILDTREKADRLNELVKLLSLSSKARLTGLIQTAARLALERKQHSQGRIPDDWTDIAVVSNATGDEPQSGPSPVASTGMKRTFSQANGEAPSDTQPQPLVHPALSEFAKFSNRELKAEQARLAKRRQRNEVVTAQEREANEAAEQDAIASAVDGEKKTTKKERKAAESRISEQQQHASTNEAARMATANLFGRFGGRNKNKNYSWMTGGGSKPSSAAATPTRAASVAAPTKDKAPEVKKGSQVGQFDERSEPGIQARDLLLVLESDGRAARSFVKGSSTMDDSMPP